MYLKLMSKSYEIKYWKIKIRWQNCITRAFVEGWINMVICLSFLYFEFHFFDYYYCCYYYYQFDM